MTDTGRRVVALIGLCLIVVVLRVTLSGMAEYRRGEAAASAADVHEACVHYGRAIHMYLPLSPVPGKAADRLLELAGVAQDAGAPLQARFCLEELRSGYLSVRSAWQPGAARIAAAEERLVPLMLADERGDWPDSNLPSTEREAEVRRVLASREDPALGWVLLMGFGWLGWLGGAVMAILQGVPGSAGQAVRWPIVLRWGAISLVGYGLWLLGVAQA